MDGSGPGPTSEMLEAPGFPPCNPSDPPAERGHRGGPGPPLRARTDQRRVSKAHRKPPPKTCGCEKAEGGGGGGGEKTFIQCPDKPLSVQQGTHWRAYKQGDKRCLQRLKGRKRAQLALEGGMPVPPGSTEPGFLLGWEAELGALLACPFPSSCLLSQPDTQEGGPASPRALLST